MLGNLNINENNSICERNHKDLSNLDLEPHKLFHHLDEVKNSLNYNNPSHENQSKNHIDDLVIWFH